MKKDMVFECRKCGHFLFADKIKKLINKDCPECGEAPDDSVGIWIFLRMGDYEKEYGKE
jgi:hypothetical protein